MCARRLGPRRGRDGPDAQTAPQAEGGIEAAMNSYRAAREVVPDEATNGEAPCWVGITLTSAGRVDAA